MSVVSTSSPLPTGSGNGRRWLEWGVRLGYAARALLWGIISVTALALAFGVGGHTQGSQGALRTLADERHGTTLLVAVAVGLAAYAVWRLFQAATNHEDSLAKSLWMRLYYGTRGVLYGLLALSAWRIVGQSDSSGGGSRQPLMSRGLQLPAGRWIVGAVGVGIFCYGLWQWYRAATRRWNDDLDTGQVSARVKVGVDVAGVVGYLARGVVIGVIGGYVVWGAATSDASMAMGTDQALGKLTAAGYGPGVLGIVAAGLVGFALFSLAEAFYRRIET